MYSVKEKIDNYFVNSKYFRVSVYGRDQEELINKLRDEIISIQGNLKFKFKFIINDQELLITSNSVNFLKLIMKQNRVGDNIEGALISKRQGHILCTVLNNIDIDKYYRPESNISWIKLKELVPNISISEVMRLSGWGWSIIEPKLFTLYFAPPEEIRQELMKSSNPFTEDRFKIGALLYCSTNHPESVWIKLTRSILS